jgi:PadR family transcriptional regulator, regulatory protein PadR|nr:PadR family transcriptional regulator [Pseudalkalibacillus hwajinpoensis]
MLKGLLEGSILSLISKKDTYGYELLEKLREGGFLHVSDGTIYPLLLRLEKEKLIESYTRPFETGPRRKYYFITEEGLLALKEIQDYWKDLKKSVNLFMENEEVK